MEELYNHLYGVIGDLTVRNSSIGVDLSTLEIKLLELLQLDAIQENAELEKKKVIDEINKIIMNISGDVYHSSSSETKLKNVTNYIGDLVGDSNA